jgi:hypothetical protein
MTERPEGYMQQHLVECMIDNAGEGTNILKRGAENPVPWPEILVLMEIHGENSIYDIRPVGLASRESAQREKERMMSIYGRDVIEAVYAGKSPNIEFFMPGWPIDPAKAPRKVQNERPKRVAQHMPDEEALDTRI